MVTDHAVRGTIVGHVDAHRRRFHGYSGQEGIGGGISRVFDKSIRARRSGVLKVAGSSVVAANDAVVVPVVVEIGAQRFGIIRGAVVDRTAWGSAEYCRAIIAA